MSVGLDHEEKESVSKAYLYEYYSAPFTRTLANPPINPRMLGHASCLFNYPLTRRVTASVTHT